MLQELYSWEQTGVLGTSMPRAQEAHSRSSWSVSMQQASASIQRRRLAHSESIVLMR